MKISRIRLLSLAAAAWLALLPLAAFFTATGFASEADEKRAELARVQAQMDAMARQKEAARREAEAASYELEEVMGRLHELQTQGRQLAAQQDVLNTSINENKAALTKKQAELAQRLKIYKQRLRDIYINGSVNYLDVLLGARDFSDFSSRMYLLQKIIAKDIALLDGMKKDAAEIKERQDKLEGEMKQLQANRMAIEAQEAQASAAKEKRAQMLYKAEEAKHASEEEYDRLLAISENIASMLRNLENSGGGASASGGGTGRFMWPCHGEITSYYGWRTHPIFGTTKYHSGMDIAVDYGTPIHAADSGTVVYSGWLGGYGNCVMIDHGGGLVSLYGHNQSLNVGEGQYVAKGTVIAYAGSTGYSTGPHCHFEVRLHGEVTEPLNYLP